MKNVIAIDGFSSCGKSTFARTIADETGSLYIDSGAMYRGVTLWALENGMIKKGILDEDELVRNLDSIEIDFSDPVSRGDTAHLLLNGEDAEDKIRNMEVSDWVSPVSKIKEVREKLVSLQQKMAEGKSVVMDGRDIGSVVFPDADIKIFMTASPEIRAERRFKELKEKGKESDFMEVLKNINKRDEIDQSRKISPLSKPDDAVVLDNSHMTPPEQMQWFRETFKDKLGENFN